jgi:tetratricopeptide (TPR) repeat protein
MRWIILMAMAVVAFQAFSQTDRKYVRKGNRDFNEKNFQQAEIQYRKALEKNAQSVGADYNLGNALYRQKQFDAAASRYSTLAEKDKNKNSLSQEYYNLGNALYNSGKYKESIEAYKNSLRVHSGDMDAKHNLQMALRKLAAVNQKQKEDQNNQKKNDGQKDQKDTQSQSKENENKGDNKDAQQPPGGNENSPQEPRDVKGQISPQDAERILQALENEEKNVLKKVQDQKKKSQKAPVDKNW